MKFLSFGLLTISSLFAAASAAPTSQVSAAPSLPVHAKELGVGIELETRTENDVCSKLKTTIVEVKKHTATINATVESVDWKISQEDKTAKITLIKGEVSIIVGLINTLAGECLGLVGTTLGKVEQKELIQLVLELIFEIVFTLKKVILVLRISIFELLGNLIFTLLTVIGFLLTNLNLIVDGLLKIVFTALGSVVGLLNVVLSGLLPIVLGIVGGVLGKVGGILSCLF